MRRNSWRTDSGRPHIWTVSTRPGADLAQHELAGDPGVVEQPQRPAHDLRRRRVPEVVRDDQVEVPVVHASTAGRCR